MSESLVRLLPLALILIVTIGVACVGLYKSMNEEMRLKFSVLLLSTGSIAALATILMIKPVGMITVVGSLTDAGNDYVLLPFVIAAVAVINLIGDRIHKDA